MKKLTQNNIKWLKETLLTKNGDVRANVQAITSLTPKTKYRSNYQIGDGKYSRVSTYPHIKVLKDICNLLDIKYECKNDAPRGGQLGDYIILNIRKEVNLLDMIGYVQKQPKKVTEPTPSSTNVVPLDESFKDWFSIHQLSKFLGITFIPPQSNDLANELKTFLEFQKVQDGVNEYPYNMYKLPTTENGSKKLNEILESIKNER